MTAIEFASDSVQAELLPERGARLHRLRVFGRDLLRTPDDMAAYDREPFFWGAFVMAPWCNRIATEPVAIRSRTVAVASNFADGSAIHGQAFDRPWERQSDGEYRVMAGGDGWPWRYETALRVVVEERRLRLSLLLRNLSDEPMPGGLGIHPWFRRPVRVAIRGHSAFSPNTDSPAEQQPVKGALDLRELGDLAPGLDATWTDLADPPVELEWPAVGIGATLRASSPALFIVAASPPELDAIAVEPQTHAPQGLRRLLNGEPGALTVIEPGQALTLDVELAFRTLE